MSFVKTANVQIGTGPSASNNFHWRNLLDGLLRLSRGNAGSPITDVMRVRADNSVEFPGGVADGVLGAGQTWQNVTASRAVGMTYTNTTGRPIAFTARSTSSTSLSSYYTAMVNGASVAQSAQAYAANAAVTLPVVIVPPGATYSVQVTLTAPLSVWMELR